MASLRSVIDSVFGGAWHVNHKTIMDSIWPATDGTVEANKPLVPDANKAINYLATSTGGVVGFHGATPIVQPTGSAQALVTSTPPTTSNFGYSLAQATAVITLLNEVRNVLVNNGLMKGSA